VPELKAKLAALQLEVAEVCATFATKSAEEKAREEA
jgi:uncharacterized small protein (DUF1192 family)